MKIIIENNNLDLIVFNYLRLKTSKETKLNNLIWDINYKYYYYKFLEHKILTLKIDTKICIHVKSFLGYTYYRSLYMSSSKLKINNKYLKVLESYAIKNINNFIVYDFLNSNDY